MDWKKLFIVNENKASIGLKIKETETIQPAKRSESSAIVGPSIKIRLNKPNAITAQVALSILEVDGFFSNSSNW